MQYSSSSLVTAYTATNGCAHGVVTEVQGANGYFPYSLSCADSRREELPSLREADTYTLAGLEKMAAEANATYISYTR